MEYPKNSVTNAVPQRYPDNSVTQTNVPAAMKGTLEALLQRASFICTRASDCGSSIGDLEDQIIGHRNPKTTPAGVGSIGIAPKAVASGFIDKMDEALDAMESFLDRISGSLEHLHSKR